MNLDKISIEIRPRNSWKSFDLGCAMALKWWKPLMGFWFMTTFPLFLIACLISPEFGPILIWLCKPLFERGLLYIFSRKVFGEEVTVKQAIFNWPRQLKKMWFSSITYRRFSPSRGFDLAVVQLEGLTGVPRSRRLSVLHKTTDNNSGWWLIICVHWEMFFLIGLLTLVNYIIPQGIDLNLATIFNGSDPLIFWVYNFCLYLVWLVVAPIFIGGSFASYLNRRIILEGWDIELNFRKISSQSRSIASSLSVVALCLLVFNFQPNQAFAQQAIVEQDSNTSADAVVFESESRINEILAVPPFNESQTVKKYRWTGWEWKFDSAEEKSTTPPWVIGLIKVIAAFGEFILWGLCAAILILLVYLTRDHIKHFVSRLVDISGTKEHKPIHLPSFSKAYEDDGLPVDMGAEVTSLLASESYRKLLSLFLVTSLIEISKEQHLPLTRSMTEQECLQVIKASVVDHRREFMQSLIDTWTKLAWAHKWPSTRQMNTLSDNWKLLFQLHSVDTEPEGK